MLTIVDDRNLGWSLGASEYMTKPIDRARLLTLVRALHRRRADAVVLVVDDDPEVRDLVRATLRRRGPEDRARRSTAVPRSIGSPAIRRRT